MPKIFYSELAIFAVQGFIRAYEEAFFELYQDSGLVTEQMIIENYRLSARNLSEQIFSEIEKRLSMKQVLGRKKHTGWRELSFYIRGRLIIVYYTTEAISGHRIVETIGIERKPIIF